MNCTQAKKLVYAFSDGQLEVKDNCELLDHLKMCPNCARVVDEHHAVRDSLRRAYDSIEVPAALASRVRASLPKRPERARAASERNWRVLIPAILATAACVMFGMSAVWQFLKDGRGFTDFEAPPIVRGIAAATDVASKHTECCLNGAHHRDSLPLDPGTLGSFISAHYADRLVAVAPDLSQFQFQLESANLCGVQRQACKEGGHLVYASSDKSVRLSVFSVPRWDCLDKCGEHQTISDGVRSYTLAQDSGAPLTVVCWHRDATTYIVCSPLPRDSTLEIANHVRSIPLPPPPANTVTRTTDGFQPPRG